MKRISAMLIMFMLASCLFVVAQSEQTGAANGPMTIVGCVAEKGGHYMVMNKEHPEGVELMGHKGMKSHVGHQMQITGTMKKEKSGMALKVKSMKMMSEKCESQ